MCGVSEGPAAISAQAMEQSRRNTDVTHARGWNAILLMQGPLVLRDIMAKTPLTGHGDVTVLL